MKKQEFIFIVAAYFHIFANGQFNNYGSQIGTQVIGGPQFHYNTPPQICEDKNLACSQPSWKSRCHGIYRSWMIENCQKTCGICNSGMNSYFLHRHPWP